MFELPPPNLPLVFLRSIISPQEFPGKTHQPSFCDVWRWIHRPLLTPKSLIHCVCTKGCVVTGVQQLLLTIVVGWLIAIGSPKCMIYSLTWMMVSFNNIYIYTYASTHTIDGYCGIGVHSKCTDYDDVNDEHDSHISLLCATTISFSL